MHKAYYVEFVATFRVTEAILQYYRMVYVANEQT